MTRVKIIQIWQHKISGIEICVLDIVNKIVVAETIPNKAPIFLTSVELEENYKMIKVQPASK